MKAKLLKEQLGLPAGTELDVVSEGRAVVLAGPTGHIVVAAEDVEVLPEKDPTLLVNILGDQPGPQTDTSKVFKSAPLEPETGEPETEEPEDADLDEPLPDPQPECDGESCESCQ